LNSFHKFQIFRQFSIVFSQIWLQKRYTALFSGICDYLSRNPDKTIFFHQKFADKNAKFDEKNEKNRKFNYSIAKKCWRFLAEILSLKNGAKECKCIV